MKYTKIDREVADKIRDKYLYCKGKKRHLTYLRAMNIYFELYKRTKYKDTTQIVNNVVMLKGFCLVSLRWFEDVLGITYEEVRKIIKFLDQIQAIKCIKKGSKDRLPSVYYVTVVSNSICIDKCV